MSDIHGTREELVALIALQSATIVRMRAALGVGRDCVMESFDYVKTTDDQVMADARLLDIDDALGNAGAQQP